MRWQVTTLEYIGAFYLALTAVGLLLFITGLMTVTAIKDDDEEEEGDDE